jgi:outer membrane receptor protein involved in Fe transport
MTNEKRLPSAAAASHTSALACGTALALAVIASLAQAADPTPDAADAALTDIVVTGSLIKDPNHESSSPIVITSTEEIKQSGTVTLESALNQLPEFTPSGSTATGGQGTGGHATLNLHGLGSNRNLVLLDGRRLPPADITGDVDINLIPESILSGIQTITGGASAVYGSDAMSGVVNFITLKDFEGVSGDAQYGNSERGDYGQTQISLAFGTKFADDKGHVIVSVGDTHQEGLLGNQRGFFDFVTPSSYIGSSTFVPSATNLPSQAAVNALFSSYGVATPVSNTLNLGFNNNGSLFTQTGAKNYQGPTTGDYAILGGNVRMPVGPQGVLENPLERKSIFTKLDYELTPSVTAYGQFMYVDSDVYTASGHSLTQFGTLTTIPVTNPFIPASLATLLASRPNPTAPFTWNTRYVGIDNKAWDEDYKTSQFLGGLKGDLGIKNWTWDIYADYDNTDHYQSNYNAVLKSQVQNLLNAPDGGKSICAGGYDPFGIANNSNISAACQGYMSTTAHSTEAITQLDIQGVTQGSLFTLPAGDVQAALLADHRRNTYRYSPDSQLADQNIEAVVASAPASGAIGVNEVALQLDIPLLADVPFAKRLSLGTAFRHSDYTTSGGVNSYAGDIKWTPAGSLLVRAGYQRAVRAPNIGELFGAAAGTQVGIGTPPASIGDPCDIRSTARTGPGAASVRALCLAQGIPASIIDNYVFPTTATAGVTHGNPALIPETANTYNFGVSWNSRADSPLLRNITASVDFYDIKISNVISVVPGLTAISKCYNLDGSNPTYSTSNPFCELINRDTNGQLVLVNTPYFNLGGLKTSGIDAQFTWKAALADLGLSRVKGGLFFNTGIGFSPHYAVQTLPGTAFQDYAGTNTLEGGAGSTAGSYPKWKGLTTLGYEWGPGQIALRWRVQSAMEDVTYVTTPKTPGIGVDAYNLFDLFGSYAIDSSWSVRAGVTNLMNHGPVYVSSSQNNTDPSVFDIVGRSWFVGVHVKL